MLDDISEFYGHVTPISTQNKYSTLHYERDFLILYFTVVGILSTTYCTSRIPSQLMAIKEFYDA